MDGMIIFHRSGSHYCVEDSVKISHSTVYKIFLSENTFNAIEPIKSMPF
jgi:hypothetical protein